MEVNAGSSPAYNEFYHAILKCIVAGLIFISVFTRIIPPRQPVFTLTWIAGRTRNIGEFRTVHLNISPSGEIGSRAGFKIQFRKECRFESDLGHQDK